MVFSATFNNISAYRGVSFLDRENLSTWRKPSIYRKELTPRVSGIRTHKVSDDKH